MTEIEELRLALAYAIIHAQANHSQMLRAYAVLAEHYGPDNPASRDLFRTHPCDWSLRGPLLPLALGRDFLPGESMAGALAILEESLKGKSLSYRYRGQAGTDPGGVGPGGGDEGNPGGAGADDGGLRGHGEAGGGSANPGS